MRVALANAKGGVAKTAPTRALRQSPRPTGRRQTTHREEQRRRTAGHALPAPARPAEEPPQNRRRRTRHAMQQILRHAIEHELDRLTSND